MILSVFFFSISAILSQFEIRLMVPSTLTTMGPRWSRDTVEPPVLMSSCVAFEGAAGRARGALGGSASCFAGAEACEELLVEDIVNVRGLLVLVLLMKVGA